jgi:5'-3' exoribonuclease 2
MLGIATHEPHFRVLREDVFANDTKPGHCRKCNQPGHKADECRGTAAKKETGPDGKPPLKPFIWLHVGILREYLAIEMSVPNQPFRFDLERALDDWVFMCFFVGNDFLPHLPSLDIREDGIDTLIAIWRDNIPTMGGYVTKDGHVDLARAQIILEGLAKQEDAIFKRRREGELKREANEKRRAAQQEQRNGGKRMRFSDGPNNGAPSGFDETVIRRGPKGGIIRGEAAPDINALPTFEPGAAQTKNDPRYLANLTHADIVGGKSVEQANRENKSAAAALKEKLMGSNKPADNQKAELDALFANGASGSEAAPVLGKRTRDMIDEAADDGPSSDPSTPGRNTPNNEIATGKGASGALGGNSQGSEQTMPEDTVKLWEEGYQGRYYEQKFHVSPDDIEFRHQVARSYVEGLSWVLLYYFQGCPSWTWYYPYHYAPFAADFVDLDKMEINFEKGEPFRPYEQLMGVMPAASNHVLPEKFHPLMEDEDSPIKEFYPEDFEVDLNGKKFAWQGVALLPFIDEKRLLDAMNQVYPLLTDDENARNTFGEEVLIFSTKHPLYDEVSANFFSKKGGAPKFKLNPRVSEGLHGKVSKNEAFIPDSGLVVPFDTSKSGPSEFGDLENDESVSVNYHMPVLTSLHKSMLLPGVKFNEPALNFHDVEKAREQANRTGRSFGGVQLSQNGDRSDSRRINYAARDNGGYNGGYQGNHGYGANGGYGNGGGYDRGSRDSYAGQAAQAFANLPPHLAQQAAAHGFGNGPPPMPPQQHGYPNRPPPQQYQQPWAPMQGQGGYRGPPPPQRGYDGHERGGYGGYDNRNGGYGGGHGGGRRY